MLHETHASRPSRAAAVRRVPWRCGRLVVAAALAAAPLAAAVLEPAVAPAVALTGAPAGAPAVAPTTAPGAAADAHLQALREHERSPVDLVLAALEQHDLLIFDDALHNAVEPFELYQKLLRDSRVRKQVRTVFLEVVSLAAQPHLDAYLASSTDDRSLLAPVFRDDYSGYGWRYATYLDLLATVREINQGLPPAERLRVVGVDQPIWWEAIHTRADYELFQESLAGRDFFLYAMIRDRMHGFRNGEKAFFLTNTRHAYMRVRDAAGRPQLNTAGFFARYDPGRAWSARLHNATLAIEGSRDSASPHTTQGLETKIYRWVRMEDGAWDRAFAAHGNVPVGLEIAGTPFGAAPFIGNTMTNAAPGSTMADAYDALIFVAPLDELHFAATTGFYVTPAFRPELARRIRLVEGDHLAATLADEGVATVDELLDRLAAGTPAKHNSLLDPGEKR
ncbi:MAG: hypothetical protein IPJ17_15855 [Holophagales bacterium]|nr:MAG: hypothetical protein IPJ17_15855 [Holophagales bacterium]